MGFFMVVTTEAALLLAFNTNIFEHYPSGQNKLHILAQSDH